MCDESKIPDRDTCQKLTEEFAGITATNEALAQTFLQDHDWDLYKSIDAFYDALVEEKRTGNMGGNNSTEPYDPATVQRLFGEGKIMTGQPPPCMTLLSWNLDGLDNNSLKLRTEAIVKTVIKLEPDVVFFQEVVPDSADYIQSQLPEYKCIKGGDVGYFTMTMLRVFTIFYDKHLIFNYPETTMGRNLLITEAHMGKLKFQFLNTHLESSAEQSHVRCQQLKMAFDKCLTFNDNFTVIFGGDLNLRDKEVQIPPNFNDLWEYCGSNKECRYTWDMTRNTNHTQNGKFKPRCRFDRVYIKFGKPQRVKPVNFTLTGFERVPNCQMFPSDHWGLLATFDLNHSN